MKIGRVSTERPLKPTLSIPLLHRLLLLALAAILPLMVMAGFGLYALVQQQRRQLQRVGLELARALATAVDAELRSTVAVLDSLATSPTLDRDDLPAFHVRAERVLTTQVNWAAVMLASPSGKRLVDTRFKRGVDLPPIAERETIDAVVRSRGPAVGNLARGAGGDLLFAVRTLVIRNGDVHYVLSAIVKPEAILEVIRRQRVPNDWVISIFDAKGLRVARSRAHRDNLGGRAAISLQALMATGGEEGVGQTFALEGDRIYTAYSRLRDSGWVAAPGIPASLVEGAAYRSLRLYGGGVLISIVLGTVAAVAAARSISRPIRQLRAAAQALGHHESFAVPHTSIPEITDVAHALAIAAEERTRSDMQRELLLQKEQDARAVAEAANRTKDEFLAVLSHELRTPLNAVYGWARMLRSGQVSRERAERALDAIVRNANAQVQLIDDLLDVSRVSTGKMRLDVRSVELRLVVEAALDAVRPAAEAKGIRLESMLDPRVGAVNGDPDRLRQVVWNLLLNAVKFTPRGGDVRIRLQRMDQHVEIVVSDTGVGIRPDVLPFVFERFRQGDSSSTRAHSGLGLGLALVKHLVELHGGNVDAHSDGEGKGATFVVQLPIPTSDARPAPVTQKEASVVSLEGGSHAVRLDGIRVLVVDDDEDGLDLATAILTGAGAVVKTCRAAPEALELVRRWRPDVLLSDIEMPGEDGYSLIRNVRALGARDGGEVPAVALTAYGGVDDRVRALNAGYSMHIPKPVDPQELTTIIAGLTSSQSPTGES
jgi:signal transduction histidine kinase/ActR/RegA family two-component response regulator